MTGPESSVDTGDAGDRAMDVNSGWRGGGGGREGGEERGKPAAGLMDDRLMRGVES